MRWPWQKAEVRNYTDSIVSGVDELTRRAPAAITALSTAALQACAQLYANALGACAVTGPPGTVAGVRCLHGDLRWRRPWSDTGSVGAYRHRRTHRADWSCDL